MPENTGSSAMDYIQGGLGIANGIMSLADGIFGISNKRARANMAYQYQLNEKAAENAFNRQKQLQGTMYQQSVNSAINAASWQRQGLQRAGLNAAMMQGNQSANVAVPSAPSPPQGSASQGSDTSIATGISGLTGLTSALIQKENIDILKKLLPSQIHKNDEEGNLAEANAQGQQIENEFKRKLLNNAILIGDTEIEINRETAKKLRAETSQTYANTQVLYQSLKESQQRINNMSEQERYQHIVNSYADLMQNTEISKMIAEMRLMDKQGSAALTNALANYRQSSAALMNASTNEFISRSQDILNRATALLNDTQKMHVSALYTGVVLSNGLLAKFGEQKEKAYLFNIGSNIQTNNALGFYYNQMGNYMDGKSSREWADIVSHTITGLANAAAK